MEGSTIDKRGVAEVIAGILVILIAVALGALIFASGLSVFGTTESGVGLRIGSAADKAKERFAVTSVHLEGTPSSYFKLNNDFDDVGPNNDDGSGSGGYNFSTDVPFAGNTHSLQVTGGFMKVGSGAGFADWSSTEGTISFWVKWNTLSGRPWGQDNNMEIGLSGSNLVLDWGRSGSLSSSTDFVLDKWYFIAVTWSEVTDTLILYVGDQTNPPSQDAIDTSWTDIVSGENSGPNTFLSSKGGGGGSDAYGDELRYWITARSLSNIQSDYNRELAESEITGDENLRVYIYNFGEIAVEIGGVYIRNGTDLAPYPFATDRRTIEVHEIGSVLISNPPQSAYLIITTRRGNSYESYY